MQITINYQNKDYTAKYNKQSGYYEVELETNETGINEITITAVDLFNNIEQKNYKFQVLKNVEDKSKYKEKDIVYIFDNKSLKLKDIQKITDYMLDLDDETNASSTLKFSRNFNAIEKDYALLKKDGDNFLGLFKDLTEMKNNESYSAQVQDISNIFDEQIFLTNENLIKDTGIEDFIKKTIEDYFSKTYDSFVNLSYIDVIVKTHTILKKSVDVDEAGLYNFHTFITNCKQNYNIFMDYEISNGKLIITIEKKSMNTKFIDCTVADVMDYKKIYGNQITGKVEVLCKDTGEIKRYCLNCDREVKLFEDVLQEDRIEGKIERVTVENSEEAYQSAVDKFKGNDYNYLIQFSLSSKSLIMSTENLKIGTPVKVKTKENQIVNGYITARTENKDDNIIIFKVGKIRRTLRQQLKKEMIS